jgi:hypothetical protein
MRYLPTGTLRTRRVEDRIDRPRAKLTLAH